jgi:hypothetical protein
MGRVRVNFVAVEQQEVLHIMGGHLWHIYPVCNGHAPYYIVILWPVRLYNIFPRHLKKRTILEKKLFNIKCVFLFSLQILPETSPILKKIERYKIKNVHWSSSKVPIILDRF